MKCRIVQISISMVMATEQLDEQVTAIFLHE